MYNITLKIKLKKFDNITMAKKRKKNKLLIFVLLSF